MNTPREIVVTQEMLDAAMREFERYTPLLRYPEKRGWHLCDKIGMREAIIAAMKVAP